MVLQDSTMQVADATDSLQSVESSPMNQAGEVLSSALDTSWSIGGHSISVGNILIFISILVATQILVWVVRFFINRIFRKQGREAEAKRYTIRKLSSYVLFTMGTVIGLDTIGIDITILVASSAALLIGIGLGMQHIFDDIISGFVILFEGVIKVGDVIQLGNLVAKVQQIDIRTSKVITKDGNYIVMPNSKITTDNMINWSTDNKASRFLVDVGVAYESDVRLVKELLLKSASEEKDVLKNPVSRVEFVSFGDSALQFRLYIWAKRSWEIETLLSNLHFAIDQSFRDNNIKIPFPQRELYLHSVKES